MRRHGHTHPHSVMRTRHMQKDEGWGELVAIPCDAFPTVVLERLIGILQGQVPPSIGANLMRSCENTWNKRHRGRLDTSEGN